jgi:uncharacterized protein (DUF362 family)
MRLDSRLLDPLSVFIYRRPVPIVPTAADFEATAQEALAAMDLGFDGEPVMFHPNVTAGEYYRNPDSGIVVHPAFVAGLVHYARAHGADSEQIHIVEDPHNQDDESPATWEGTGYLEVAREVGAHLAAPTRDTIVRVTVPRPLAHQSRLLSSLTVTPGTVYINVPKLKTHNLGITTLCMKNQQGIVYVLERHYCAQAMHEVDAPAGVDKKLPHEQWMDRALHEQWQLGLARRLSDLAQIAVPQLNVIEGVVGRDGTGFNRGSNIPLGLVVAGVNVVAVDSVASYLMGFDPQKLIYLRIAAEAGVGTNDLSRLHVYSSEGGSLAPCADLERWRATPPFRVISGVIPGSVDPDCYR